MSVTTRYSVHTEQKSMISGIQKSAEYARNAQRSMSSGQKYLHTSEMTDAERQQSISLQNSYVRTMQLDNNAKNFAEKIKVGMESVDRIQSKVSEISGLIAEKRNLDPDARALFQSAIKNALNTMQVEMNSTYAGGGYVFAPSASSNSAPVGDIVNGQNYGADKVPNTNYVNNPSGSNKVTVAEGMSFNTDLNPADKGFRDTIAALHMMLDNVNDQSLREIPDATLEFFNTAQSELSNFLATNLKPLYDNTQSAIAKNDNAYDNILEQLESFKADPVEFSARIADENTNIERLIAIISAQRALPSLLEGIR